MPKPRKHYSNDLKARVALEAIKGHKAANEIAAEYGVHPTQIAQWKKQDLDGLPELFSTCRNKQAKSEEDLIARLYRRLWLSFFQKNDDTVCRCSTVCCQVPPSKEASSDLSNVTDSLEEALTEVPLSSYGLHEIKRRSESIEYGFLGPSWPAIPQSNN